VRLRPLELAELLRAQVALLTAQVTVWTKPVGQLVANDQGGAPDGSPSAGAPGEIEPEAVRVALAINRAAAYGLFRPLCLVRAVALHRSLESRGLRGSHIRVGVRRQRGKFAAHAWVEYKQQILGDREEHVGTFATLDDLRVLRNA
jgi:hypothetical protein